MLYSIANFPLPVVLELRVLGHDVVTIQERGLSGEGIPVPEVLAWASRERRAVLTLNRRDFIRLHHQSSQHAGIVFCTIDSDFAGQAARIDRAVAAIPSLAGQLIRVYRPDG